MSLVRTVCRMMTSFFFFEIDNPKGENKNSKNLTEFLCPRNFLKRFAKKKKKEKAFFF